VLRQDGTIGARYIDVDFRTRTEPAEIVEALRALRSS
jgi:hypothetical protein